MHRTDEEPDALCRRGSGRGTALTSGGADSVSQRMGSAGRKYEPGQIHRSDVMAAEGLYEDGANGIRRLTEPELRVKDQDRDGVQAEVLYGILGAAQRLQDPEAEIEMMRIYNEWLAGFCVSHPERFAGLAAIPSHSIDAAVDEIKRVAARGAAGRRNRNTHDLETLVPSGLVSGFGGPNEAKLPVHFHTIGTPKTDTEGFAPLQQRQAFAVSPTGFQMAMSRILMEIIYGGVLEAYPDIKIVIGESGIGWIPYILDHMDLEWEEQFKDLNLEMKPSDYWHRQFYATYQSDKVGTRLLDCLGEDNIV